MRSVQNGQAWQGFAPGSWQATIDVVDFVRRNYTPYEGAAGSLGGPPRGRQGVWKKVSALFPVGGERGIYDVDPRAPAGITAFGPGYIDRDAELIVGLQTDA